MTLSVVIACLNEERHLGEQLEALARQRWDEPWDVVIADNGSSDGTLGIVERYRPRFRRLTVVDASDRRGQSHALNVGVRAASGDALLFCDADDIVDDGWMAAMGLALRRHDFVACHKDCTTLNPDWVREALGFKARIGLHGNDYHPYLPHTGAGSVGIKRWLHEKIGGFNEGLVLLEATDYCFRAQLAGAQLYLVPDALLHYRLRRNLLAIFRQGFWWSYYNVVLYKLYRQAGERDRWRWRRYAADWMSVLRQARRLHTKGGRGRFLMLVGRQLGRLAASLRHGVVPA